MYLGSKIRNNKKAIGLGRKDITGITNDQVENVYIPPSINYCGSIKITVIT